MHSAIVAVVIPEPDLNGTSQKWMAFLADLDGLKKSQTDQLHRQVGVRKIADSVWEVNFQQNPAAFSWLVSCAVRHKLHYGILQLDGPPQWFPGGFDPKVP
ncbi:MAG: hypothetical protein ABSE22_07450 [Xanthobacteraceae bacterium]|jgi:hypothetical protein